MMIDEKTIKSKLGIFKNIKEIKSIDEIYDLISSCWLNFEQPGYVGIEEFITENYVVGNPFEELSNNDFFISSLKRVIKKYHLSREEFTIGKKNQVYPCQEDCSVINSFILLLGFPIAYKIEQFSKEQIIELRNKITWALKDIEIKTKYEASFFDLSTIISYSTHNLAYCYHPKNLPKHTGLDWDTLFDKLKKARMYMSTAFIIIPQISYISTALNEYSNYKQTSNAVSLSKVLSRLFRAAAKVGNTINNLNWEFYKIDSAKSKLLDFVEKYKTVNEKIINIIIIEMTRGILDKESTTFNSFSEMIMNKIGSIDLLTNTIKTNCLSLLSAYSSNKYNQGEWSNKIFITTVKTLSSLEIVNKSNNNRWKTEVVVREYYHWLDNIHEIINRNIIVDDWALVKNYILEENPNVEWKSSFFTPIQGEKIVYSENIFLIIVKNILGMMNSKGGHILVGKVEKPNEVKNEIIKKHLFIKNNNTFFDIGFELKNSDEIRSNDLLKRRIQDKLTQLTGKETSHFDNNWDLKELILKNEDTSHTVFLIEVRKSDDLTLCIEDKSKKTYSLIKRLNGKTENIDMQGYLKLKNAE